MQPARSLRQMTLQTAFLTCKLTANVSSSRTEILLVASLPGNMNAEKYKTLTGKKEKNSIEDKL